MYTLLFADDTDEIRKIYVTVLREHDYTVLEAGDGYEALSLARNHLGPIDLLITDVVMPRLGGRELCRALRDAHPETRVLFISGYHAEDLGADASFLQKPFTPQALLHRVKELLSDRSLPDHSAALNLRSNVFPTRAHANGRR